MRNDFETGYLMHWGLAKGAKAKNHKYFERVEKAGKYIYFYTQAAYEAWLHKGSTAVDKAKKNTNALVNKARTSYSNTRSSMQNYVSRGQRYLTSLTSRSSSYLTKSNVNSVIDRGSKTIGSLFTKSSNAARKTSSNIQNKVKSTTDNISRKAKTIASNVEKTIKKAGKDTSKVIQKYVSKGESTIKSVLNKTGNISLNKATNKHDTVGSGLISSILLSVGASLLITAAMYLVPKVVKKAKEIVEKIFPPKEKPKMDREEANRIEKERIKDFASDSKRSFKENTAAHSDIPQKDEVTTRDEDMAAINPNYIPEELLERAEEIVDEYYAAVALGDIQKANELYDEYMEMSSKYEGYMQNCANCTLAYDLRRRGYDVDAPWNPYGTNNSAIKDWYVDAKIDYEFSPFTHGTHDGSIYRSEANAIKHKIENKFPEGSYGHLNIIWTDGGGHDVVWSIENGELIIRDCQSNEILDFEDTAIKASYVSFMRTDDKKLTDKAYAVANADKANAFGDKDTDTDVDDKGSMFYDATDSYTKVNDDGTTSVRTYKDDNYDKYWNKAAGKRR